MSAITEKLSVWRQRLTNIESSAPSRTGQHALEAMCEEMLDLLATHLSTEPGEAEGWRSMDSAPKDGSRLMLWHVEAGALNGGWPTFGRWRDWQPGIFSWRSDDGAALMPAAWQPSPAAPLPEDTHHG